MAQKTISIGFQIEDSAGGLKKLTMDADGLKKAIEGTLKETDSFKGRLEQLGNISFGLDAFQGALSSMQGMMSELTQAYAVQSEAETKLATNMRNTMAARDEDIQSIKDLCSAQQQLGVIGDEVQLAGAQELTTYLEKKSSLEKLIPVMNDMLAQQYGLNATSEAAANIATMLGKVMDGQTGALRRYGYSFDKAQEAILKTGTEEERAAVLAEVVTSSVGGMNAALAATPAGRMKQAANNVGDLKERLGEMAQTLQPGITLLNQMVLGVNNLVKVGTMVNGIIPKFQQLKKTFQETDIQVNILGKSMTATGTATKAMAVTFKAAMMTMKTALISTGIGVAIWGLGEALAWVVGKLNGVKDAASDVSTEIDKAKEAQESLDQTMQNATAQITGHIAELKNWTGTKEEERKKVEELNNTYGDTMGTFSSVKDWYDKLTSASQVYADQMVLEAKARILANDVAELQMKRSKNSTNVLKPDGGLITPEIADTTNARTGAIDKMYEQQINKKNEELAEVVKQSAANAKKLNTGGSTRTTISPTHNTPAKPDKPKAPEGSIAALEQQKSELEAKIKLSVDPTEMAGFQTQIDAITEQQNGIRLKVIDIFLQKEKMDELRAEIESMGLSINVDINADQLNADLAKMPKPIKQTKTAALSLQQQLQGVASVGQSAASAFSAMGEAFDSKELNVAGIIAGAIANILAGYAAADAQAGKGGNPWVWLAFTIAGLATAITTVSQVKQATAFANGGIVSGPTMALVGEYAGASNNPEVIAPLNRLRELLPEPGANVAHVEVTGRLRGSDIELSGRNYRRIGAASGRRYS